MSREQRTTLQEWLTPNGQVEPITEPLATFALEWCETCQTFFIRCPRCGNNSCNGTYGEEGPDGRKCPVCPAVYAMTKAVDEEFYPHFKAAKETDVKAMAWCDLAEQREAALHGHV